MKLLQLRNGRLVAILLVVGLVVVLLLNAFSPTRSAYSARITNSGNSAGTAQYFTCTAAVGADTSNALFAYRLTEASGSTTATDWSGKGANGTYQGSMTATTPSPNACPRDAGSSYVLNGSTSFVSTPKSYANPTTFSEEVWFRTTSTGDYLMGFGNSQTGTSSNYDRHVYVDANGRVTFGTYPGSYQTITSPQQVNDGAWHHVVATFSASTGMNLYLDGSLAASNPAYTAAQNFTGWWRIGYDNLSTWPNAGSNSRFTGSMRYAAVYSTVLSATQVANHAAAGR